MERVEVGGIGFNDVLDFSACRDPHHPESVKSFPRRMQRLLDFALPALDFMYYKPDSSYLYTATLLYWHCIRKCVAVFSLAPVRQPCACDVQLYEHVVATSCELPSK